MTDDEPDTDRVQDAAEDRRRERAELAEHASRELEGRFNEFNYPVSSEELAVEYGDETIDLANETESLGSVFDRLVDEQYETPTEVREAVYGEITGKAAGTEEYNAERDLDAINEGERFEGASEKQGENRQ